MGLLRKWTHLIPAVWLILIVLICVPFVHGASGKPVKQKDVVEYVSPNIGGIGQLLTATIPYVQLPYGMARLAPVTTPNVADRYLADKIYGFPAGPALLMVSIGQSGTWGLLALGNHQFTGSYVGILAIMADTVGKLEKFACGQCSSLLRDGKRILPLTRPADVVLLRGSTILRSQLSSHKQP